MLFVIGMMTVYGLTLGGITSMLTSTDARRSNFSHRYKAFKKEVVSVDYPKLIRRWSVFASNMRKGAMLIVDDGSSSLPSFQHRKRRCESLINWWSLLDGYFYLLYTSVTILRPSVLE